MIDRQIAHYDQALARITSGNRVTKSMLRAGMASAVHLSPSTCVISRHADLKPEERCNALIYGYLGRYRSLKSEDARETEDPRELFRDVYGLFRTQTQDLVSLSGNARFRDVWHNTLRVFRRAAGLKNVADLV